jgi:hypothetical protein
MSFGDEMPGRVRDTRHAPGRGTLDGLIAVLERVAASRAAETERELEEPGLASAAELNQV